MQTGLNKTIFEIKFNFYFHEIVYLTNYSPFVKSSKF
jgi:hypothetical protein